MTTNQQETNSPYLRVYHVLDEVCFDGRVDRWALTSIHTAIDELRRDRAPVEHIRIVERVSVALHKLERALRCGSANDVEATRAELQTHGAAWLQTPLGSTQH